MPGPTDSPYPWGNWNLPTGTQPVRTFYIARWAPGMRGIFHVEPLLYWFHVWGALSGPVESYLDTAWEGGLKASFAQLYGVADGPSGPGPLAHPVMFESSPFASTTPYANAPPLRAWY